MGGRHPPTPPAFLHSLPPPPFLSVSLSLTPPLSFYPSVFLSLPTSLCFSLPPSLPPPPLSLSRSLSPPLSPLCPPPFSTSPSLPPHSLSLSVAVSLSPPTSLSCLPPPPPPVPLSPGIACIEYSVSPPGAVCSIYRDW